jgi:hypothetical protein
LSERTAQAGDHLASPFDVFDAPPHGPVRRRARYQSTQVAGLVGELENFGAVGFLVRGVFLQFFPFLFREPLVVCHLGNQVRDIGPERVRDKFVRDLAILDGVVKQRGNDQIEVLAVRRFSDERRDLKQMVNVRLLCGALAPLMDMPSRRGRAGRTIMEMAAAYCRAVLSHEHRITLDGAPAEAVGTEAKDLAAKQLAKLAARKAAKKIAEPTVPAAVKPAPAPTPPPETAPKTPEQLRARVRAALLRRSA